MSRVFIGVGHGGKDPGAVANGLREKDINLVMALEMTKVLTQHGVGVGISRTVDEADPLQEELAEAKAFAPDLAVEVHNNAGGGDGFEVYVQTGTYREQSRNLAQLMEEQVKQIGQNSRGIKTRLMANGQDYLGVPYQEQKPNPDTKTVSLQELGEMLRQYGVYRITME